MSKYRISRRKITVESLSELPFLSIAVFLLVAWYILTKIAKSGTFIGDLLARVISPDQVVIQERKEENFYSSNPTGSATYTPQKVGADAKQLALAMGTFKGSTFWDRERWFTGDGDAFDIIKLYTNPNVRRVLSKAYTTLHTDSRDMYADLNYYLKPDSKEYLRSKNII